MLGRVLMWRSHINEIGRKVSVWYCYNCNTIYAVELCILQSTFLSQFTIYPGVQPIYADDSQVDFQ